MATLTIYKNLIGRFIGESDGSGTDSTRDALLNDARKFVASQYPFECYKKTATVSISSNVASLPTDLDYSHVSDENILIYSYTGTDKTTYSQVPLSDISRYSTGDYRYAIDIENAQVKCSEATATLSMEYFAVPADLSSPTDADKFPISEVIARYAAGQYWQSIEEEENQAQINFQAYDQLFAKAKMRNEAIKDNKRVEHYLKGRNLGFN